MRERFGCTRRLLLPLGLELGGYIFLALGLAPRRREPELGDTVSPIEVATPAKRGGHDYYLQRLERDHPAIAKRVHAGELSVYAASVAAGLRKAAAKRKWNANVCGQGRCMKKRSPPFNRRASLVLQRCDPEAPP
jgi:hypothetical protein